MIAINVRDILAISRKDIHDISEGPYQVTYEDGNVVTSRKKEIIFNRYVWELILAYPSTPIHVNCNVKTYVGETGFNGDTHIRVLEAVFKHVCIYNNIHYYKDKDYLCKLVYDIINWIFNEIVQTASAYVSGIDAIDFVNLVRSPEIVKIHSNVRSSPDSIERAYKEIKSYISGNNSSGNRFLKAYRSKAVNDNQANQCIGPIGIRSDLDRSVFNKPIMPGFISGLSSLYELLIESRTAAKSLNANDTHIRTSEYASRRIQLLAMSVTGVETQDCGSTDYFDMVVTKDILDNIHGKYYLTEEGKLDYIRGDETHLIDKIIKFRTTFGCHTKDRQKICTTCLGKISENFKENSNLGYIMIAYLMEKMTQTILSTKHLTHSVKKFLIKLLQTASKYFYTDMENNLYIKKDLNLKGLQLILPNSKLNKLVDVMNLSHTNIALNKIGELELISIRDTKQKSPSNEVVDISYQDRHSIITKELLVYIKGSKLESDSRGNFVIPLDNWNKDEPIFSNPVKEKNIISFVNKIASMIETTKDKVYDPYDKLNLVFNTVIDQFKCNLSVIEVMVYATTAYDAADGNYKLARNSPNPRCENKTTLFRHRNISQLLIFEEQNKEILGNAPIIFSNKHRMGHPSDVLFRPQDVVKKL